ncbi:MAG: tetraacyldisaccharide 4'-kinase [Desulfotignum sp.]|nr:tetraacyldisaccharide 4'-kinase [Desulfotignum sp.]MCF8124699.1 tetraacyldisaccharide 4'-kinase [Desulfotignum sp.]
MFKALEKKIIRISGRPCRPTPLSFETLLVAVSHVYSFCVVLWHRLYKSGCIPKKQLPCPVISVGNITAGGTGKTPMTIYLADLLIRLGKKPAVISRGYKGSFEKRAAVVGNGKQLLLDAHQAGDEPHMMARLKRFPVVVGKNRYQAGCMAVDRLAPDVVVLDDGFQHIQLKRNLDLVLMDHDQPFGNGRILPAGRLREPAARALARAHAVILTRCPEKRSGQPHPVSCIAPGIPVFYTFHQPFLAAFYPAGHQKKNQDSGLCGNHERVPDLGVLKEASVVLFSGIADNQAFFRTIRDLGGNVLDHLEFEDHYRYKRSDIQLIQDRAGAVKAQMLVTTQKDWGKLDTQITWPLNLAVVGVQVIFDDEPGFCRFIKTRFAAMKYS